MTSGTFTIAQKYEALLQERQILIRKKVKARRRAKDVLRFYNVPYDWLQASAQRRYMIHTDQARALEPRLRQVENELYNIDMMLSALGIPDCAPYTAGLQILKTAS